MKKQFLKWGAGVIAAGAAVVLLDSLFLEKYFFDFKTFDIGEGKRGQKLNLLLLTDLHLKHRLFPYHHRLAKKINQLQPDLLLLAGDTLDSGGQAATADQFFSLINQKIKKVAIHGNHDYLAQDSLSELKQVMARHNCQLLVNESVAFRFKGVRLVVTGLDDFIQSEGDFENAVENIGHENHHLLLVHSPLQHEKAVKAMERLNRQRSASEQLNIRYVFAGHNHGGQVRLPGYVPVLPEKSGDYVQGWYNEKPPFLYLSKGFGTSRLPFRFGARSELTQFWYHA